MAAELSAADMIMKGHSAPYTQPRHKKKVLLKRLMHTIRNHLRCALSENIEVCVVVRDGCPILTPIIDVHHVLVSR